MTALQITSTKALMSRLLNTDAFDDFLLEEASIRTKITYTIDGHINTEFYSKEEQEQNCPYSLLPWSETKGLCFDLIKGKRTPLSFKFVFHLKPEKTAALLTRHSAQSHSAEEQTPDSRAITSKQDTVFVLTLKYDEKGTVFTTCVSYQTFVPNQEAAKIWDKAFSEFLAKQEIPFEIL